MMRMLFFVIGVSIIGYLPSQEFLNAQEFDIEELWSTSDDFLFSNRRESAYQQSELYTADLKGRVSRIDLDTGEILWQDSTDDETLYNAYTANPVSWNDYVILIRLPHIITGREYYSNIYFYDRNSGELLKVFSMPILENSDYNWVHGQWLSLYGNKLYFSMTLLYCDEQDELESTRSVICVIELDQLDLGSSGDDQLNCDILYEVPNESKTLKRLYGPPLFQDQLIYIPVGGDPTRGDLVCMDLDGRIIWQQNLIHTGNQRNSSYHALNFYGNDLLLWSTLSGLALVNKNNGEIIYDIPGSWAANCVSINGDYAYSTDGFTLRKFHILSGEVIWENQSHYSRDSNPILYMDRVYLVESDALRVYSDDDGSLIDENNNFGVTGAFYQGFIPNCDGVLYIQQDERIVAIKLVGNE